MDTVESLRAGGKVIKWLWRSMRRVWDFMIRTPKRHQKIFRAGKDDLISPFKSNSGCWEDRDGGNLY